MNWEIGLTPFLFFGLPFFVFWAALLDRIEAEVKKRMDRCREESK